MRGMGWLGGSEEKEEWEVSRRKARYLGRERTCHLRWDRQPCHISPQSAWGRSQLLSSACAVRELQPRILKSLSDLSPPHLAHLKSPQFGGESYFNSLVPISLITVSIDGGQGSK